MRMQIDIVNNTQNSLTKKNSDYANIEYDSQSGLYFYKIECISNLDVNSLSSASIFGG